MDEQTAKNTSNHVLTNFVITMVYNPTNMFEDMLAHLLRRSQLIPTTLLGDISQLPAELSPAILIGERYRESIPGLFKRGFQTVFILPEKLETEIEAENVYTITWDTLYLLPIFRGTHALDGLEMLYNVQYGIKENAETANAETANAETANADTANAETANAETANAETANAETANANQAKTAEDTDADAFWLALQHEPDRPAVYKLLLEHDGDYELTRLIATGKTRMRMQREIIQYVVENPVICNDKILFLGIDPAQNLQTLELASKMFNSTNPKKDLLYFAGGKITGIMSDPSHYNFESYWQHDSEKYVSGKMSIFDALKMMEITHL